MNIKLTEVQKQKDITKASSVVPIMHQVLLRENKFSRGQEHFWIIGLTDRNKILFLELLALGRYNRVNVDMLDVLSLPTSKQCRQIIFIHNHPGGTLTPSAADKDFTDRLVKAANLIKIRVLDHIIITETGHFSFLDNGIMDEIRRSPTWTLLDKDDMALLKLETVEAGKEAEKRSQRTIAQRMISLGIDDETIRKATGLRAAEVKKLRG